MPRTRPPPASWPAPGPALADVVGSSWLNCARRGVSAPAHPRRRGGRLTFQGHWGPLPSANPGKVPGVQVCCGSVVGLGQRGVPFRLRVGVDVVTVAEVAASLDRFGDRYIRRVFTAHEAAYCQAAAGPPAPRVSRCASPPRKPPSRRSGPRRRGLTGARSKCGDDQSGRCEVVLHGEAAALAAPPRHRAPGAQHEPRRRSRHRRRRGARRVTAPPSHPER